MKGFLSKLVANSVGGLALSVIIGFVTAPPLASSMYSEERAELKNLREDTKVKRYEEIGRYLERQKKVMC